jgi:hypothetical protein
VRWTPPTNIPKRIPFGSRKKIRISGGRPKAALPRILSNPNSIARSKKRAVNLNVVVQTI